MRLTFRYSKIAIWIFIVSTLLSGVVWEAIGWMTLIYLYFSYKDSGFFSIRKNRGGIILFLLLISGYVVYQCFALNLPVSSIIRLYGITKTLFAFPILVLLCDRYVRNENVILDTLPLLIGLDWIIIVSMITGIETLNILGGSRNYLGAINVILFPYIFKFMQQSKHKWLRRIFLSTLVLLMLFSGSRTLMLTTTISFCATIYLEKNLSKKIRYLAILIVVVAIGLIALNSFTDVAMLTRGISVFTDRSDAARTGLKYFAERQYKGYTSLQKLIGNGDTIVQSQLKPVHNTFGEVLLCYGKIGLVFWCIYLIGLAVIVLRSKTSNKLYLILVFGLVMIIGWVQPFLTSGYLFQAVVALTVMQLYYSPAPDTLYID